MICTEEEAAKRWCPMVSLFAVPRGPNGIFLMTSRGGCANEMASSVETNCIGHYCMAWIVVDESTGKGRCGMVGNHA